MAVSPNPRYLRVSSLAASLLMFSLGSGGQSPPADKNSPEVASRDSQPTFTTRSNLVLVRVVVRDKKEQANGTLQKEDFQLLDKGKPQVISKFSVEKSAGRNADAPPAATPAPAPGEKPAGEPPPPVAPDR